MALLRQRDRERKAEVEQELLIAELAAAVRPLDNCPLLCLYVGPSPAPTNLGGR